MNIELLGFVAPTYAIIFLVVSLDILKFFALLFFMFVTLGCSFFVSIFFYGFLMYQGGRVASIEQLLRIQIKNVYYYWGFASLLSTTEGLIFSFGVGNFAWMALCLCFLVPVVLSIPIYYVLNRKKRPNKEYA